ncbi:MAG: hypothetical protein Q6K70_02525, partial [Thermostichales cyanobacterium DRC_bins_46]
KKATLIQGWQGLEATEAVIAASLANFSKA